MAIIKVNEAADISLPEYRVGSCTESCTYPGILQCFAIAGWMQSKLLCTHVSPGISEEDMAATFDELRARGGDAVNYWYVAGPTVNHFAVTKAVWRSTKDIKKTFKTSFSNKAMTVMLMDTGVIGDTHRGTFGGIDIRIAKKGIGTTFQYKGWKRNQGWQEMPLQQFTRI